MVDAFVEELVSVVEEWPSLWFDDFGKGIVDGFFWLAEVRVFAFLGSLFGPFYGFGGLGSGVEVVPWGDGFGFKDLWFDGSDFGPAGTDWAWPQTSRSW